MYVRKALYCCSVYYIFITLKKRKKKIPNNVTKASLWVHSFVTRKQYFGPDSSRYKWTLKLKGWPTWKCDIWWQRCSVESFVSFEENANLNLVNPAPRDSKKRIPMANWEQMSSSSLGDDGKGMFCFWKWIFYFSYNCTNNNHLRKLGQQRQSAEKLHFVIIVTVVLTDAAALLCLVWAETSTLCCVDQTVNQYCSWLTGRGDAWRFNKQ